MKLRQRIVQEALQRLESDAPSDSATQPVVQVLVGDCNLTLENAQEAVQPMQPRMIVKWNTVWTVHTTDAGRSGDVIFVKGANAKSFDLPFGPSHGDRNIGKDIHDAIGIELRVKVESSNMPEPSSKRNRTNDHSQSARDDEYASQPSDASQLAPGNVGAKKDVGTQIPELPDDVDLWNFWF